METYSKIDIKFVPEVFKSGTIDGYVTTTKFVDEAEIDKTYQFKVFRTHGKDVIINFIDERPYDLKEIKGQILKEYQKFM